MSYNIERLTLYTLISALELDIRLFILRELVPLKDLKDLVASDTLSKIRNRALRDKETDFGALSDSEQDLRYLDYADLGDSLSIIASNKGFLAPKVFPHIAHLCSTIEKLIPIRNRVMHIRPLQIEDFSIVIDTAKLLVENFKEDFVNLKEISEKLKANPAMVLSVEIKTIPDSSIVSNNLPIPDYEETGFIGRRGEVSQIKKLLKGSYPVVTILGEGGAGKSALALRVAYDLIDEEVPVYDAIIWMSSKTTVMGVSEIKFIEGAISDSLGAFRYIEKELGAKAGEENNFEEILDYLREFKILLILDNLETVLDEKIRSFLGAFGELPPGSKILITSRISVGAYDHPYSLKALDTEESVRLMRLFGKSRSLEIISSASQKTLIRYCEQLKRNPGFIKWFVTAVAAGERAENLLIDQKLFLEFCLKNVYEHLQENSRTVLTAMLLVNSAHPFSMLQYLTNLPIQDLEGAILQLIQSNMLDAQHSGGATVYRLTEIARLYLKRFHKPPQEVQIKMNKKWREMIASTEVLYKASGSSYNINSICIPDKSLRVAAKYLHDALKSMRTEDFEAASRYLEKAKSVEKGYFEVYRVEAMLCAENRDYISAEEAYEIALQICPNSPQIRYWFGGFFLRFCDEPARAVDQFILAKRLDPSSVEIDRDMALAYIYLKEFDKADDILKRIEARTDVGERNHMIIFNLRLQYLKRRGEFCVEQNDYNLSLTFFKRLFDVFESKPFYQDRKNREWISNIGPSLSIATRFFARKEKENSDLQNILERFKRYNIANARAHDGPSVDAMIYFGVIHNLNVQKSYGFIEADNGERYFFHRTDMSDISEWDQLSERTSRVNFILGNNAKGVCAKEVTIKNELMSPQNLVSKA